MKLSEAKREFISTWGALASRWNINPTMGEIHALMLISTEPLSTEQVQERLQLSRGGAYTNIIELQNWGLIHKTRIPGKRQGMFVAEKDLFKVLGIVIRERKKRELEPLIQLFQAVGSVVEKTAEAKLFTQTIAELKDFAVHADNLLDTFIKADIKLFFSLLKYIIR